MALKPLIAIASCAEQRYMHQVIRETWLTNCPADHRFFAGQGFAEPLPDEVVLDVEDDFAHLLLKIMGMAEWALAHGYSQMFRADNDTYVCVPRLLRSGFDKHSIINGYGGAGIWMNRPGMQKLLALKGTPILDAWLLQGGGGYDDHFISQKVGMSFWDRRYVGDSFDAAPVPSNQIITFHLDQGNSLRFDEQGNPNGGRMRAVYELAKGIV